MANEFSNYYETISNAELLSILDNADEYQPLAVEAAKMEFLERGLSEADVTMAREKNIAKRAGREKREKKLRAFERRVNRAGHSFIDSINPIQPGIPSTEKIIKVVVIVFGGIFLYQVLSDLRTHIIYLKDIPGFPFISTLHFLPLLLLGIGAFAFWKKKTIGWTFLVIFLSYSVAGAIWTMLYTLFWRPSNSSFLDDLYPKSAVTLYFLQLIFFLVGLFTLGKRNIREVFSVTQEKMLTIIILTAGITFLVLLLI